jgi:subtilase family serine protease
MALGTSLSAIAPASAAQLPSRRLGVAPRTTRAMFRLGPLPSSTILRADVALRPRNPVALASFAEAVSTPGSTLYHHYLAAGQFANRFGPTHRALETVTAELRASGLSIGPLPSDRLYVPVSGSERVFARAFSTGFERYRLPSGRIAYANIAAPLLPGTAARYVTGVIGLDSLTTSQRLGLGRARSLRPWTVRSHVFTGGPQPCSAARSAAPQQDAYTADQLASAYNFSKLYGAGDEGAGVTVALFELEPNLSSDISAYQSCYRTDASVHYVKEGGGDGFGSGTGEATLDIEDVIGLAPKATIDVYQAPNTNTGVIENYAAIVNDDTAKVVSTSWGGCELDTPSAQVSEEGLLFEQAATQGQTVLVAAGDDGSADCDNGTLQVDDPASQSFVTGVGGTTLSAIGPTPTQSVWNDSNTQNGAGGGGISMGQAMPLYQSSAPPALNVINAESSGSPCGASPGAYCREVPDVSANADPFTGYLIYFKGVWGGFGGTSAAAPLWAAFMALTDASSSCAGGTIGFANPSLYGAAASAYSSDFYDITSGNNDYTPAGYRGGLYVAGPEYDMASGLGTPNGGNLAATLCTSASIPVAVANPGSLTTTIGAVVSLQVNATDSGQPLAFSATGLPAGLSISSSGLISGSVTSASTSRVTVRATDGSGKSGATSFTWTVSRNPVRLTVKASPAYTRSSTSVKLKGTVSNVLATGRVTFTVHKTFLCIVTLRGGTGTCKVDKLLKKGSYTATGTYSGNSTFAIATATTRFRVT